MDAYTYQAGDAVHRITLSPYESRLLSRVREMPPWERGVFAAHHPGTRLRIPRGDLAEKGTRLLAALERQGELIQFRYTLECRTADGRLLQSGGGGTACLFGGERAIAEAGPGYCHVETADITPLPAEARVELARQGGADAAQIARAVAVVHRRLRDLRDLSPVTSDDGIVLRARRRRHPTDLVTRIRTLVEFLRRGDRSEEVEHWVG